MATSDDSFLSRPPKVSPKLTLPLGLTCIVAGFAISGGVGGGLIGGGIAGVMVGIWDTVRLWIAPRRKADSDQ